LKQTIIANLVVINVDVLGVFGTEGMEVDKNVFVIIVAFKEKKYVHLILVNAMVVIWQMKEIKVVSRVVINVVVKVAIKLKKEMVGKTLCMEIMRVMNVVLLGDN
jgi:hypothetical protein